MPAPSGMLKDNVIYYIKEENDEGIFAYAPATLADLLAWGTEDEVPLYVSVIAIDADHIGEYSVHAQGVKYDKDGNKIGVSSVVESTKVIVPSPEQPINVKLEVNEMPEI